MVFLILFFHLFLSLFSPSWGLVPVFSLFARCHFFFFFFTNELYFLSISFLYFASLSFHCSLQAKSVNFHWLFLSWYDFFPHFLSTDRSFYSSVLLSSTFLISPSFLFSFVRFFFTLITFSKSFHSHSYILRSSIRPRFRNCYVPNFFLKFHLPLSALNSPLHSFIPLSS